MGSTKRHRQAAKATARQLRANAAVTLEAYRHGVNTTTAVLLADTQLLQAGQASDRRARRGAVDGHHPGLHDRIIGEQRRADLVDGRSCIGTGRHCHKATHRVAVLGRPFL